LWVGHGSPSLAKIRIQNWFGAGENEAFGGSRLRRRWMFALLSFSQQGQ